MPSVDLCLKFLMSWGTPNTDSDRTAKRPSPSTNQYEGEKRYSIALPMAVTRSIHSMYDWKSVHCQKNLRSKSKIVKEKLKVDPYITDEATQNDNLKCAKAFNEAILLPE
jgi:hypothetical protein